MNDEQLPANLAMETLDKEVGDREVGHALLEQVKSDLDDVERALHRLEEGTYGLCEACGQPIDDLRLEALPAARHCVTHQRMAEQQMAEQQMAEQQMAHQQMAEPEGLSAGPAGLA